MWKSKKACSVSHQRADIGPVDGEFSAISHKHLCIYFKPCAKCQQGKDMVMNGSHILVLHWEELSKILSCPAMKQASGKVMSCLSL